jgi:hypothetical protein
VFKNRYNVISLKAATDYLIIKPFQLIIEENIFNVIVAAVPEI